MLNIIKIFFGVLLIIVAANNLSRETSAGAQYTGAVLGTLTLIGIGVYLIWWGSAAKKK